MQYQAKFDPNSFLQEKKNTEIEEEFQTAINSEFKPEELQKFVDVRNPSIFQKGRSEYGKVLSADEAFDECGGFGKH